MKTSGIRLKVGGKRRRERLAASKSKNINSVIWSDVGKKFYKLVIRY